MISNATAKRLIINIHKSSLFVPVILFIISFIIYIITLAPTYLPPDGGEFALCIQSIGICHPTGFFLYILLGKLLTSLIPFGTLIYKVNLLSAVFASGTLLFSCLSLLKMGVNRRVSFFVVLVYAFTSSMWEFANSADVFTFGTLLLSITIYMVIASRFYLSFLFLGLLTSHFPNSIILLPVLIWYWKKTDEKSMRSLIQACGVFLLGLLFFIGLLFIRMHQEPIIDWGHVATVGDFYNYLTRKEFGGVFLIQTQQTTFGLKNFSLQLWAYTEAMFMQFGFVLPIIAVYTIIRAKLYKKDRVVVFLILSFFLLAFFNIFSLSTLNPGVNINFQFAKFYLSSFTILILLLGIGLGKVKGATARNYGMPGLLIIILIIQLVINFTPHNYSHDTLSQQMVNDALSELPNNAIAITVTNQNFFEAWYEQLYSNKYKNITLLYVPNNVNADYEKYHPELFSHSADIQQAIAHTTNNPMDQAILSVVAQNPNRPIFIWQGIYENEIFTSTNVIANMLSPYGLWWRVRTDQSNFSTATNASEKLLNAINYTDINTKDLNSVQSLEDLQTYTEALQPTSFALASMGRYDESLKLLTLVNSLKSNTNIQKVIAILSQINVLEPQTEAFIKAKNGTSLLQLGMYYYQVKNYNACIKIFNDILTFDPKDPKMYTNIAIMYALENDNSNALTYYNKALKIDPHYPAALDGKKRMEIGE